MKLGQPEPGDAGEGEMQPRQRRLHRDFTASTPNWVWVADFAEVVTQARVVYAGMVDVYSRAIVGLARRHQ